MSDQLPRLNHIDLGVIAYDEALTVQEQVHGMVVDGGLVGAILTLQHPNVLTLGRHAQEDFILEDLQKLKDRGIAVCETDRGGEVTAHNPGQLVVYPIMPQSMFDLSPKKFVYLIEEGVIEMLRTYGLKAARDEEHPGVWLGKNKICALGVRIKQRVSMHGLALNVCNDLTLFDSIIPCGIQGRGVTNLTSALSIEGDRELNINDVRDRLLDCLSHQFQVVWQI